MKPLPLLAAAGLSLRFAGMACGHDITGGGDHPHDDFSVKPPGANGEPIWFLAQADTGASRRPAATGATMSGKRPIQAAAFEAFAPKVSVRWDEKFLFIESNGMPAHNMMVGITAWQQQVPLPQNYTGANAWQLPLAPVPAKEPRSIKGAFLRGAIAISANGIPIFNPQNNRGEISQEIGELDEWGGHCGRADDYHYHAAPLHLQTVLGKDKPIAYALDGYAIYGLTEPDGSPPAKLDEFNGHTTAALGYHYHASKKYPYVNGGFHGEVTERDQQVDPQPRAQPVRRDQPPLRGAKITAFETSGNSYKLSFEVSGEKRAILYTVNADGSVPFEFQNGSAGTTKETFTRREGGGGRGGPGGPRPDGVRGQGGGPQPPPGGGGGADRPPRPDGGPGGQRPREQEVASKFGPDAMKKPSSTFLLTSSEVKDGGALPMDFTGDGSGATLPLAWTGAPAGTQGYALIMDHLAPGNVMKHYWTMWDIPATTTALPKNVSGIGKLGTSFKGQIGYEPPHSQGPGAKTYVLTVYALSAPLQITQQPREVNRDVLLAAMEGKVLASASLSVVHTRGGTSSNDAQRPPRREGAPPPNDSPKPSPSPAAN